MSRATAESNVTHTPQQDADAADREPGAGGGGEGGQGEEAEVAKADAAEMGRAQKPWAGLPLEGMKGSARWPIRREPLMSAKFLADTGVLPKVGEVGATA